MQLQSLMQAVEVVGLQLVHQVLVVLEVVVQDQAVLVTVQMPQFQPVAEVVAQVKRDQVGDITVDKVVPVS
jgi:hypothetical protein